MDATLDAWIERERCVAADEILACISATDLVKARPAFGRVVRPAPGSVVASPSLADWNPDPDYFFHWYRDSAIVIDALRLLWIDGAIDGRALTLFADFLRFGLNCARVDGRTLPTAEICAATAPNYRQFLRSDEDLAAVFGAGARADTRIDPDGRIDVLLWGRPQHDGPALRALTLMRWSACAGDAFDAQTAADLETLLRDDLEFAFAVRDDACLDLWEEENGRHYYTTRVLAAALQEGAQRLFAQREIDVGARYAQTAKDLLTRLDAHWSAADGYFRARSADIAHAKDPDVSILLAVLHADDDGARHGCRDPRIAATLSRLETYFSAALTINRDRDAPALGRYPGDVYFGGGAWYIGIFGAAERAYRCGDAQRGDAFMETARAFAPPDGLLSEQIDRDTGAQISAKRLAWSYAAFVSCVVARQACLRTA
jgi:glucoamylase